MQPERLLNIPCTIHTVAESTADIYGDPTTTTANTTTLCWVDRRQAGTEDVGEANWQTDTLDLYLPAGTTVTGDDRVTVNGLLYELVGPPHTHLHPRTTGAVYVGAKIRRVS